MKITILHPSRGRAQKAFETYQYWMSKASGKIEIEYILSIDVDDNQQPEYSRIFMGVDGVCYTASNRNVVDATNVAASHATGDLLIYLSDDFKCPQDWDILLYDKYLSGPVLALIKVDDCLQGFDVPVLTIPIMTRYLYITLGYFWHPEYKSMFVDQDLYEVCKKHGWIINAPQLKFPHEHCSIGKAERDETYIRSEKNWDQGKELFAKRRAAGFPL
jgi:glycosyltransferase involved in cell wall biosynthesis